MVATAFPFFVGSGRSGTTLLRAMFDSHPQLAIPGESHFVDEMIRDARRFDGAGRLDVDAFVSDLCSRSRFRNWGLDPDVLRSELQSSGPSSVPDAISL